MPLPKDCKQVHVFWIGRLSSTVYVPTEVVESYDPNLYGDPVSEYLSDTFGNQLRKWEVMPDGRN